MNVPGHLAAAYLLARLGAPRVDRLRLERLGVLALGALLPDLIDKPLMWIGATPYGRTVGHSLLLWCLALTLSLVLTGHSDQQIAEERHHPLALVRDEVTLLIARLAPHSPPPDKKGSGRHRRNA